MKPMIRVLELFIDELYIDEVFIDEVPLVNSSGKKLEPYDESDDRGGLLCAVAKGGFRPVAIVRLATKAKSCFLIFTR